MSERPENMPEAIPYADYERGFEWPDHRNALRNDELWQLFRKYERLLATTHGASDGTRMAWATMCNAIAGLLKMSDQFDGLGRPE